MPKSTIVVDLGFGDAGKGSMVDYLTRQDNAKIVFRFNGGAQAGHNVHLPDGRHHTFSQFGSGTFAGAKTFLSNEVMVDPLAMFNEAMRLEQLQVNNPYSLMMVERLATIVTPYHIAVNRIKEKQRGDNRHGSCGMGIGEAQNDKISKPSLVLNAKDLDDEEFTKRKLLDIQNDKIKDVVSLGIKLDDKKYEEELMLLGDTDGPDYFANFYKEWSKRVEILTAGDVAIKNNVIFEGAQGILLDEWRGFHPHTTWSNTTADNAHRLRHRLGLSSRPEVMGMTRAYQVKHGAGPLPTYDAELTEKIPDEHNKFNEWQREFRCGWLDIPLFRYAIECSGGVDYVAVTCVDLLEKHYPDRAMYCSYYDGFVNDGLYPSNRKDNTGLAHQASLTNMLMKAKPILTNNTPNGIVEMIKGLVRVKYVSKGPTHNDKVVVKR